MKHAILWTVLIALLRPGAAWAQEQEGEEDVDVEMEEMERQIERDRMKAEFEHENALRQLEIEEKKLDLEKQRRHMEQRGDHGGPGGIIALFFIVCFVVNILAAIWVYLDIRARKAGSGIWIVVTLLSGLFGVLIYGIIRLGDTPSRVEDAGKATAKK